MFKMKRMLSLLLAGAMTISMCACSKSGRDDDDDDDDDKKSSSSSSYEDVIDNYFTFLETGKSKYLKKCYIKEHWNYYLDRIESEGGGEFDDIDDYFEDHVFEELRDEFGKNYKITYEITDKEELDEDDLEDIREDFIDYLGMDEDITVDKGYKVRVDATIKGNGEEETDDAFFVIVRVNKEWDLYEDEGLI